MPSELAAPLFPVSLAVTLAAAGVFANRLDHVGVRLGLPEALLGLLTALAADGPEVTSAIVALVKGEKGVGFGVVAGSNVFNLAAMIGLSALVAGRVHLPRGALVLEGVVAVLCTAIASALVLGWIPAGAALALFAGVVAPYVVLLARGPDAVRRRGRTRGLARHVAQALVAREHAPTRTVEQELGPRHVAEMVAAVALIVLGSIGMVETAISLADGWGIPRVLVGVLILAPLTSLPNAFTGVRLGLGRRGSALVSETLNSNTINLAGGVVLPALVVGTAAAGSTSVRVDLVCLAVMTLGSLVLLGGRHGMGRRGGAALVALYAAFVAIQIAYR
jgi:cation:H+ antiporter